MEEKYNQEVHARWGNTDAYREHTVKTRNYTKEKWDSIVVEMNDIFVEFAACKRAGIRSDSSDVRDLVVKLQNYITQNYYTCTKKILSGLGQMYLADERFRNNINKHGEDTAEFVSEAIALYCKG